MHSALTIAGSDCSGGAGIQADLKAFSANGVFGQSAIVALVDENTQGVYSIQKVPAAFITGQITSCLNDIGADSIKIGMLDDADVVRTVRETLLKFKGVCPGVENVVLDPVMVSTSGHKLLEDSAISVVRGELIPLARVITPNLPEAELLLGHPIKEDDFEAAVRELAQLGGERPVSVFLKAGHLEATESGELVDFFYNAETDQVLRMPSKRIETLNTHGTGCTLSSAIAANLARGESLNDSALNAKNYTAGAIIAGSKYRVGKGHGPVHHFYKWY